MFVQQYFEVENVEEHYHLVFLFVVGTVIVAVVVVAFEVLQYQLVEMDQVVLEYLLSGSLVNHCTDDRVRV